MAVLSITAANVLAASGATIESGTAGATITAGDAIYQDSADDKWKLADNTTAAKAGSTAIGIALNGASDGQPLQVFREGNIDLGATLTVGEIYVVSTTAGGIEPEGDLASNDFVTVLGVATTADNLLADPIVSGAQVP